MISIDKHENYRKPCAAHHDIHKSVSFDLDFLVSAVQRAEEKHIRSKRPAQDPSEAFEHTVTSRKDTIEALTGKQDFWITLHGMEFDPVLGKLFREMIEALENQLPPPLNRVLYCTGSLFISRGTASTPYHMDFGNNLLLQLAGSKRFNAYNPENPEIVTAAMREEFFYSRNSYPASMEYRGEFDRDALIQDLTAGMGIYMPATTPHLTATVSDGEISVTASMGFLNRLSESMRRRSIFDYRLPRFKSLVPGGVKDGFMATYEKLNALRNPDFDPRHENYTPRAALS